MKKIIGILILITSLLLSSCGAKYPPVESTAEEAEVLFTMSIDNTEYDVKYELYRAMFLTHKSEVDGGDASVWEGERRAEYVEKINGIIIPKIANIYATINLAEKIGVNFSSNDIKKTVDNFIKLEVEGGIYGGEVKNGYGTYEKYLSELKARNLNYSTSVLLFHYVIAQTKIAEYYIGTLSDDNFKPDATVGNLNYTRNDVKAFYDSDECVRILRALVQHPQNVDEEIADAVKAEVRAKADSIHSLMLSAPTTEDVSITIIQNTFIPIEEAYCGMIIGTYTLDELNYKKITQTAFELELGEVSEVLEILTGDENGYHILYKAEKSDAHFEEYYSTIKDSYLNHAIGKMINDACVDLLADIDYADAFEELSYKDISMD